MESTGLCDVCGGLNAIYTCRICGKRVCAKCMTVGGACRACIGGRRISDAEDKVDEVNGLR